MITENLSTLKIYQLTQEQYDERVASNSIDPNALYMTPDEGVDLGGYAEAGHVHSDYETKSDANAKLTEAKEYTDLTVSTVANDKADKNHNHDDKYDTKGSANTALNSAKEFTTTKTDELSEEIKNKQFYVTVTDNGDETYSADKTFDELTDAYNDGKLIYCNFIFADLPFCVPMTINTSLAGAFGFFGSLETLTFTIIITEEGVSVSHIMLPTMSDVPLVNTSFDKSDNTSAIANSVVTKKFEEVDTNINNHISNISNPHKVTKTQVGLGNVDNTSDINKPVSTAQKTAIDTALSSANTYTDGEIDNIASNFEIVIGTMYGNGADLTEDGEVRTIREIANDEANDALISAKAYTDEKTANILSDSTVNAKISTHNTSTSAHSDIRDLITGLTTKLNNFLDVDDTTTDQLSEIITLINNNKGTLESLTSSKINVSDIVNNLTTNNTSKVLSAAQGVAIKALIDELQSALDEHTHAIADVSGLQAALDGKAASSHGTHVSYSTTAPVMDGTASVGSASTVARSDHKHPTDTSRASKTEFDNHVADTTKHITSTERTNWGTAYTHSQTAHAPSNAEKNQNAFSNITIGTTTVAADSVTDTVTFVGSNVTITPDATNDTITFAVAGGSTSTAGILKLTNSTSSTSTTTAATPNSVKSAYDLANTANTAAIAAQSTADGKADASHSHEIADVTGLQTALDGKASSSHGTHVSFDATNKPKMDGTAAFGTSSKVARADHVHPTDTSRASQTDLDALETVVSGKADSGHTHSAATTSAAGFMSTDMVTKLNGIAAGANKTTVDSSLSTTSTNPVQNKVVNSAITANTNSISTHTSQISALQTAINDIQEITSEEVQSWFA